MRLSPVGNGVGGAARLRCTASTARFMRDALQELSVALLQRQRPHDVRAHV